MIPACYSNIEIYAIQADIYPLVFFSFSGKPANREFSLIFIDSLRGL